MVYRSYVKGVVKYCGLERFIERAYSAGELKTASKTDLVKFIIEEHQLENPWMVGDRPVMWKPVKETDYLSLVAVFPPIKTRMS